MWIEGLQALDEGEMATCDSFQLRWSWIKVDGNNIGDNGCKYLSLGNWKGLKILNLCIFGLK